MTDGKIKLKATKLPDHIVHARLQKNPPANAAMAGCGLDVPDLQRIFFEAACTRSSASLSAAINGRSETRLTQCSRLR